MTQRSRAESKGGVDTETLEDDLCRLFDEDRAAAHEVYERVVSEMYNCSDFGEFEKYTLEDVQYLRKILEEERALIAEKSRELREDINKNAYSPVNLVRHGINVLISLANIPLPGKKMRASIDLGNGQRFDLDLGTVGRIPRMNTHSKLQQATELELDEWGKEASELYMILSTLEFRFLQRATTKKAKQS